jgi:hypothetical protein
VDQIFDVDKYGANEDLLPLFAFDPDRPGLRKATVVMNGVLDRMSGGEGELCPGSRGRDRRAFSETRRGNGIKQGADVDGPCGVRHIS